jgi:hypothetical protein
VTCSTLWVLSQAAATAVQLLYEMRGILLFLNNSIEK